MYFSEWKAKKCFIRRLYKKAIDYMEKLFWNVWWCKLSITNQKRKKSVSSSTHERCNFVSTCLSVKGNFGKLSFETGLKLRNTFLIFILQLSFLPEVYGHVERTMHFTISCFAFRIENEYSENIINLHGKLCKKEEIYITWTCITRLVYCNSASHGEFFAESHPRKGTFQRQTV